MGDTTKWHSELRDEMSPVITRFKGKPRRSDRRPVNEPGGYYIPFVTVDNPHVSLLLNIENEQVRAQLEALTPGTWYRVTALGRGEAAELFIELPDASEIPTTGETGAAFTGTVLEAARDALFATGQLWEQFAALHGRYPTAAEKEYAATILIQSAKTGQPIVAEGEHYEPDPDQSPHEADDEQAERITELRSLAETRDLPTERKDALIAWLDQESDKTLVELLQAKQILMRYPAMTAGMTTENLITKPSSSAGS